MGQCNYRVEFEVFTERHYVKKFRKAYKNNWLATENNIRMMCERIDNMLKHDRADLISTSGSYKLVKLDFAVEGTRVSPKASGNRCILFVDENARLVRILLVYSKDEVIGPNETVWWKSVVKGEFKEIAEMFGL